MAKVKDWAELIASCVVGYAKFAVAFETVGPGGQSLSAVLI